MKKKREQQIFLQIATPCTQDWFAMQPGGNGMYCSNCSKTVIDFTGFTQAEIYHYFAEQQGPVCGRFFKEQLGKVAAPVPPKTRYAIKPVAAGLLLLLLAPFAGKAKLFAPAPLAIACANSSQDNEEMPSSPGNGNTLTGRVTDSSHRPVAHAVIRCYGNKTQTDADGKFTVHVPAPVSGTLEISITRHGYAQKDIAVAREQLSEELVVVLEKEQPFKSYTLGFITATPTPETKTGTKQRIK